MKKPKLKPCPFCGGKAHVNTDTNWQFDFEARVFCANCENVEFSAISEESPEDAENLAIETWNTRVYPTEVQAAIDRTVAAPVRILKNYPKSLEDVDSGPDLYCPECDEELEGYENFCPICGKKLDWEFGNGID
ncbi:Lar family restriction alleviation protein [Oxalobacter paraformigenes]|uniref:Lar family restriction alleviation protein n=1 Tax=Oxalobacter paraformigenes TaxID=556268 RepID=C3X1P5_9BURK|nr:Lar family restriction alleviation protein [Oxalobacter paraformigenes]EEO27131.1 lar family restriction alleviation protein [Oxalobacter paraformigenes]